MMFYIAQIFGFIALLILMFSFQKGRKKDLLKWQIFSSLLFSLQYLFLNGLSGCFMNLMTMIRNVIFSRFKDKIPLSCLIIIIMMIILISIPTYQDIFSLLPVAAVVLYSCAVWQSNMTITRITEAISCTLFIIYNIKIIAITGLVSTIIELLSVLVAIYRLDLKK